MDIIEPLVDHMTLNLIVEINEFKAQWEFLKLKIPQQLSNLQRVATIASIGSSTRIEGSQLSNAEVEALLKGLDQKSFQSRDEEEVGGYAETMNIVFDNFEDISLKETYIQQLHSMLLKYSSKDQHHRGKYKQLRNDVAAFDAQGRNLGVLIETASPFETPFHMRSLIDWTNDAFAHQRFHPLLTIGTFVLHFLAIHPFQDGNGRLSRILTTWLLLQQGYAYVPFCSLESIIELNKEHYYLALRESQQSLKSAHPDISTWIVFFLQTLKKQKDLLSKNLNQYEAQSLSAMPSGTFEILELLEAQERITISDLEKGLNMNRNTAKTRLRRLLNEGLIQKHGEKKGVWYTKK